MVMNSLTAADLLKLASKNSAGVLPSGFVAVPDSILSEFKTNNDGLRIDYRAYFNAATNELVISGAAKPVLVGKLFADAINAFLQNKNVFLMHLRGCKINLKLTWKLNFIFA